MFIRNIFLVYCLSMIVACTNHSNDSTPESANGDTSSKNSVVVITGLDIEPRLKQADSLEILYFDDPDGDSLKYTRFFTFVTSNDSLLINTVLRDLNQPFDKLDVIKNCRSEGKMYVYDGNEPIKTVYFSTRCDSCCYLYFIKDGGFLYLPLSEKAKRALIAKKSMARKP